MIRRSPRSTLFPYTTRIRSRERENQLTDVIYHFHPRFTENPRIHNWQREHVEGGDVLLLSPEVLAVGVGERTTPAGAERLARQVFAAGLVETVLAVPIAQERATMHLDTVCTMGDVDKIIMYNNLAESLTAYAVTVADRTGAGPNPPDPGLDVRPGTG